MRQAVWSGTINFGLVSIPVRLYPATEPKDVRFHLYDRRSGRRVRYERVTREYESPVFEPEPSHDDATPRYEPERYERSGYERARDVDRGAEPPRRVSEPSPFELPAPPAPQAPSEPIESNDVVRGIELPTGEFVTVEEEELEAITPERSRTIDIEEFVDLAEIDPVFFEKSYYVAPAWNAGADKPYVLLHRAMRTAGMVGIGRFVLRTKPHLVAVRAHERVLGLETLFFGDEVRSADDVARIPAVSVSDRELKMAQQLIAAMGTEWIPDKHADTYREELLELLRSKPAATRAEESATPTSSVGDLMAVLKASVEAAKRRSEKDTTARRAAEPRKPRSKRAG